MKIAIIRKYYDVTKGGQAMRAFHEVRSYPSEYKMWQSKYSDISFLAHWHNELELIYIRDGSAKISVSDHSFTAHAGDLVVCDSGEIHYSDSFYMKNCMDFIVCDTNIISSRYERSNFSHPLVTAEQLDKYGLTVPLKILFDTVTEELKKQRPFYQEITTAAMRSFWYRLKRHCPKANLEIPEQNNRFHTLEEFQQLLTYLDENYMEQISLKYAAQRMNFSESHFSKIFKRLTGINFVTYVNMIRIEHAATELSKMPAKITDAALNSGFNNIRTFNRVFKEITGYTPTQYIKSEDKDSFNLTYYNRKSNESEYVENDSLTVIKNIPS